MALTKKLAITSVEGGNLTINGAEADDGVVIGGTAPIGSSLSINGQSVVVDASGSWTLTLPAPAQDGGWVLSAIATDAMGKTLTASKTLIVDRTPPQVSIDAIEGGDDLITAREAAGGVIISGTTDPGSSVKVNNKAASVDASGHWSIALKAPSQDGDWLITAVAKDGAGNISSTTHQLELALKGPGVAFTSFEGGNAVINAAEAAGGVVIGGTTTTGASVAVNGSAAVVDGSGHWTATVTAPGQDGNWLVSAVATDARGNTTTSSKTLVVDTVGPAVAISEFEGGDRFVNAAEAAGGFTVGGTAELGSSLKVNGRVVAVDGIGHWSTTIAVAANGDLPVTAVATDAAGNVTTTATTLTVDTKAPTLAITAVEGGDDLVNAAEAAGGVKIEGSTEIGSSVQVNGVAATVDGTGHWAAILTAPSDGAWTLTASATDRAGNVTSTARTVTVDTAPPAVAITAIEGGGHQIGPAEAAGGVAISGTAEIGASVSVNGTAATVNPASGQWTVSLAAPAHDGTWTVVATAKDAAGNTATSSTDLAVSRIFDVRDFGAKGDGTTIDSDAINAAIKACHDAGGGTVYVPTGIYMVAGDHANPSLGAIELLSNVHLQGDGMGNTVLKLVDNFNDRINGIVRTTLGGPGETVENVMLSDLTIDGNRANNTGHQAAFISGAKEDGSGRIQQNITIDHVEAMNCTAYGFDPHEVTHNITIENSVAHNNGLDGFVADALIDSTFKNDVSYDNDRHGFNVQNATSDFYLTDDVAYGNGVGATGGSGVTVQRGDVLPTYTINGQQTIENSDIHIVGGEFYDNKLSGILVKLSDTVTIDGSDVHDNAREGIRVEGATNTVIENSQIHDNSTESPGTYDAINIRVRDDVVLSQTVYSTDTQIHDNDIYATDSPSRYGIREEVTNATLPDGSSSGTTLTDDPGTTQSDNHISGMSSGDISVPNYMVTIDGTSSADTLTGTAAADHINGLGGDDVLLGLGGADTLLGGDGNDALDGGTEADSMAGGAGNDTYYVDHTMDVVTELPGEGTDTVLSTITYTLGSNVENLTLLGSDPKNGYGNELDNILIGNDGNNVLKAFDGNDTLDGGLGADSMTGGTGNDAYYVDNVGDVIVETQDNGAGGYDTVYSSVSYTLSDQVEALILTGTADLNATGNALANVLTGNVGNNVLDGGAGADTMAGGLGDDTYYVDHTGDVVVENPGEGTDLVYASISYALTDNVENLTLTGTAPINATGNALDNVLTGNDGANKLDGGIGADTMIGGHGDDTYYVDNVGDVVVEFADGGLGGYDTIVSSVTYALPAQVEAIQLTGTANIDATGNDLANVLKGNDGNNVLDGGAGADTMTGGLGDDTYIVDNAGDVVNESVGGGTDLVKSSVSYTLTGNVENLTLTGLDHIDGTGNALANSLVGNDSDNVLNGMAGPDTMAGGLGNDTYYVDHSGDVVIELPGGGTDLVMSTISYTLTDNVENLTLIGHDPISGTGNSLDNVIVGNDAANTLKGMDGADILDGGAGADTMIGGTGDDTYYVDNPGDLVVESQFGGYDKVYSSISYTLSDQVEALILTGTADLNATGNALANVLTGNVGNNVLDGGAGADTMAGGLGDDTYYVDHTGDVVVENPGEGTDLVYASISYALTDNVENLTLTGTAPINATGNALDNVLTGNDGANKLDGGIGADTMIGGHGDDTYYVDNVGDVVVEFADGGLGGYDTIVSSVTYALPAQVEAIQLTGTANIDATGNDLANVLKGNDGNNVLDGGAGADTMTGGLGDDTYIVDNAGDVVNESVGGGTDLVKSSVSYTLTGNVENLTLTGLDHIDGTGNALANSLVGNDSDNVLNGMAGPDTMAGGLGNDTYYVDHSGDVVIELPGGGTDLVMSTISYTLTDNVENLTLIGHDPISGTGNSLDNVIVGNDAANTLKGMDGADILDGGAGADTMIGGTGDDTYYVDNPGDLVVESQFGGYDKVYSSISYALPAQVEAITLTGTADIGATGNTLANVLTGNTGNNVLDGGAGADTMAGGLGNDTYYVDNTGDVVTELPGGGTDLVNSIISHVLEDNVENLTLIGTAAINGTGNALDNVIIGNSANNKLEGGGGADYLFGGDGSDTFVFRSTADSPVGAKSHDTIADFTQGQDKISLSAIDGNTATLALDHLVWGGQSATPINNHVTWSYDGAGHAIVQAETNGDGVADFEIQLNGWNATKMLTPSDFIL